MKAARLIKATSELKNESMHWTFEFDNGRSVGLVEKPDWPMIFGANLEQVETWLVRKYGWAIDFFGVRNPH